MTALQKLIRRVTTEGHYYPLPPASEQYWVWCGASPEIDFDGVPMCGPHFVPFFQEFVRVLRDMGLI